MKAMGLTGMTVVIAGQSARRHLDSSWSETFRLAGIKFHVYDFGGECSRTEIDAAKARRKKPVRK
jgi:hypothetical protein